MERTIRIELPEGRLIIQSESYYFEAVLPRRLLPTSSITFRCGAKPRYAVRMTDSAGAASVLQASQKRRVFTLLMVALHDLKWSGAPQVDSAAAEEYARARETAD